MIVINFIIVLGILIFVHELGHFLVAKWMGVRVEKFPSVSAPNCLAKSWERPSTWCQPSRLAVTSRCSEKAVILKAVTLKRES